VEQRTDYVRVITDNEGGITHGRKGVGGRFKKNTGTGHLEGGQNRTETNI